MQTSRKCIPISNLSLAWRTTKQTSIRIAIASITGQNVYFINTVIKSIIYRKLFAVQHQESHTHRKPHWIDRFSLVRSVLSLILSLRFVHSIWQCALDLVNLQHGIAHRRFQVCEAVASKSDGKTITHKNSNIRNRASFSSPFVVCLTRPIIVCNNVVSSYHKMCSFFLSALVSRCVTFLAHSFLFIVFVSLH